MPAARERMTGFMLLAAVRDNYRGLPLMPCSLEKQCTLLTKSLMPGFWD
ncbi:uncharacterized protein An05g01510 [Aspergillus niger]|uniref:Contig An05c0050, genomic contig n=2 Tax=Aspergillus niger TaxID=5061 RepID=A2QKV3_ASPNC|nr:uncharacterized protein An05g01510 [Aspergillus niger]CAK96490.1 unnamed protein product [Aspergillus niger]